MFVTVEILGGDDLLGAQAGECHVYSNGDCDPEDNLDEVRGDENELGRKSGSPI